MSMNLPQDGDIIEWCAFIDLMHGLANKPEFNHIGKARNKAGIRGAAGRAELRCPAGHLFNRTG